VQGDDVAALRAAVASVGGQVKLTPPGAVLATVPRNNLGALSDDARVRYVTLPRPVRPDATSEGVSNPGPGLLGATGAQTWINAGRRGGGVKVAIVDVGFQNYQSEINAGRLPAVTTQNFCGYQQTGFDGSGPGGDLPPINHGTAVAEIVHQMAPDATLYLVCIFYSSDGGNVEQYLAAQGVTVVNASIGDVLDGRGDGSGPFNSLPGAVAAGRGAGQLWSVSAGNDAQNHFNFNGKDVDNDGRVEMFAGVPVTGPDSTEGYSFTLGSGQQSHIQMKWDEWPTTNHVSTICFYQDSFGSTPDCNENFDTAPGGQPVQETQFTNLTGSAHTYLMTIQRAVGTTNNLRIDMWLEGAESNVSAINASGSLTEPATSPYAMTMAAHCYANANLEPYSSQGPTIDGRTKPDLSGPDGVSNDLLHSGNICNNHAGFYGTSAAAPHGTGAAALLKGYAPTATPDQIQQVLMGRAGTPPGPATPNNQFGNGLLQLGPLTLVVSASSGPTAVSPSPGRTDFFMVGNDAGIWQRTRTSGNVTNWLPLGGFVNSDPDAASWGGGRLDLFVRGGDNALWHRWSADGVNWSQWEWLGGVLTSGPGAVARGVNSIDVFARGGDNAVWTRSWNGSTWTPWVSLGGVITSDPDVASWGANRLDLFVRGTDNALWHRFWDGNGWSAWEGLGGQMVGGPGAVSWGPNRVDIFVRGTDDALYHKWWNGASWLGYESLGGILSSSPDVASPALNQLDVAVRGGAAIFDRSYNAGWGNWAYLGPP
jgi:Subtilase family/Repeat of unknown function (DUF346)